MNSAETTADASRVRLVLEGGRAFERDGGATLRPSLELGVRHDGGDAETGADGPGRSPHALQPTHHELALGAEGAHDDDLAGRGGAVRRLYRDSVMHLSLVDMAQAHGNRRTPQSSCS